MEGNQFEAGIKGTYLNGRVNTSLAFFSGTQKNRAVPDPTNAAFYIAAGEARVQGISTMASGEVLPNLVISGSYTYLNTRIMDNNASATRFGVYSPKHMFKLWESYKLPGKLNKWTIGSGLTVLSSESLNFDGGYWKIPGYAVVDAAVSYKIDRHLSATLNVNNLFNRYYYSNVGYSTSHLGQGLNAMLTLRAAY